MRHSIQQQTRMPWSCAACTYLNSEDDGAAAKSCCSICFLPRADAADLAAAVTTASRKRPAANNTVQATLFGGVVAKALDGNTIAPSKKAKQSTQNQRKCKDSAQPSSPSKKGPMEPSSDKSHRQGTLAFFGTSTKSTLNNIQPGTDAARECRDLALR